MRTLYAFVAVLAAALLLTSLLAFNFAALSQASDTHADLPRTAIVFTGQFDRIHTGLDLMTANRVDQLFITGVNPKAGLRVARFADQFALTPEQADWITAGRIFLAPDAHSTLENALEAACWMDLRPEIRAVTLITSQRHMARASLALQRAIAPVDIVRVPSDPSETDPEFRTQLPEFRKFLTTWVITLLPHVLWPADEPELCNTSTQTR